MALDYEDFDEQQKAAVFRGCSIKERIVAVTGPAGTGKTSLLHYIHQQFTQRGYSIALCAPTGKAAKRIHEATGIQATTIHRLLEYPYPGERDPKTGEALSVTDPKRCKYNPLQFDCVIVDEYAMVNWEVHRNLVDAIKRGGLLRVFGDANQLKPIEANKRLAEEPSPFMMLLSTFHGIELNTIHRQSEGSGIIHNGNAILHNRFPERRDDFTIKVTDRPTDVLREHVHKCRTSGTIDYSSTTAQIIVPTKKTWVGTVNLNAMLQSMFQSNTSYLKLPRHTWAPDKETVVYVGDKVIWTENDYNIGIYNGESGIVVDIDHEMEALTLDLGDRIISVPAVMQYEGPRGVRMYDPRKSIDLAYAITCHKAQGSEWEYVCYVLNKSSTRGQSRANFYTAITRARKVVYLITDQRSMSSSVFKTRTF